MIMKKSSQVIRLSAIFLLAFLLIPILVSAKRAKAKPISTGGAVDLGLSVKWAACNLGAVSPADAGGLYGWGDSTGNATAADYSFYPAIVPPATIRGSKFDVARAELGAPWRLPTKREIQELIRKCSWKWITYKGVGGMMATGPNGNCIFFPAAGSRSESEFFQQGEVGFYWSGTVSGQNDSNAYGLSFFSGCNVPLLDSELRFKGFSVRPVR